LHFLQWTIVAIQLLFSDQKMNKFQETLKKYWGYENFRPLQEDIIRSVADEKRDTLGLLPTGGGKSIIFQVPAMVLDGVAIVVTPLIALMKDQVENLQKRDIKAIAIYSGMTRDQIDITLDNCAYGNIKFLYVSPERIETEIFKARIQKINVNLIVVDEAHCISQWGYDFRPSYLKIKELRKFLPQVPILALTATATAEVVEDIQDKLGFKRKNVFQKSFERKNLVYIVRHVDDKLKYLLKIATKMNGSTGIVYVRDRKKTKEISEFLRQNGFYSDFYHAGLRNEERDFKQNEWKRGKVKIIVATNAFGMGIDKPDVRFVVHLDLPDSIEAYFQEAGRGGRDELKAYAILLFNESDRAKATRHIENSFPEKQEIRKIYNALGNYFQLPIGGGKGMSYDFNLAEFATNYHFSFVTVHNSLKILERCGYLELTDEINNPSLLRFIVERNDLYKFQVANAKFDNFIKLLLRTYTGIFTEYAKIDEENLAKRSGTTRDVIYQYLVKLSTLKIINYIPQRRNPVIIYTEERLDDKSVFFANELYKERKDLYTEKINSVLNYVSSTQICRSQLLLNYFGQSQIQPCGQCDVCSENKKGNATDDFSKISASIFTILEKSPETIEKLVDKTGFAEQKVVETIQWLLDNNSIKYNHEAKLCRVENSK
jgi:ATP-dependent DNA helicase RecQ